MLLLLLPPAHMRRDHLDASNVERFVAFQLRPPHITMSSLGWSTQETGKGMIEGNSGSTPRTPPYTVQHKRILAKHSGAGRTCAECTNRIQAAPAAPLAQKLGGEQTRTKRETLRKRKRGAGGRRTRRHGRSYSAIDRLIKHRIAQSRLSRAKRKKERKKKAISTCVVFMCACAVLVLRLRRSTCLSSCLAQMGRVPLFFASTHAHR